MSGDYEGLANAWAEFREWMKREGHVSRGDFWQILTAGPGASATAGPIGRQVSAGEGWKMNSPILTYSRAHGLFAGMDQSGAEIERDGDSTGAVYGKDLSNTEVLTGEVTTPAAARVFVAAVKNAKTEAMAKK